MVKNTAPQAKPEWPASSQRGLVRKRRDSRIAYYQSSKYFHRNIPGLTAAATAAAASPAPAPAESASSRPNIELHQLATQIQPVNIDGYLDYINAFRSSSTSTGTGFPSRFIPQEDQAENSWYSATSMVSYTLPIHHQPNSPQSVQNGSISPNSRSSAPGYNNDLQFPYHATTPAPGTFVPDAEGGLASSSPLGSFDSFDSLAMSAPNTATSPISESYVYPSSNGSFGSPVSGHLQDLTLADGYYQSRFMYEPSPVSSTNSASPLYPDSLTFDADFNMLDWTAENTYTVEDGQYSAATQTHRPPHDQAQYMEDSPMSNHSPWNSQFIQRNEYGSDPDAGCVAFEPNRGSPYAAYRLGEQFLETDQQNRQDAKLVDLEPVSPSGTDDWQLVSSQPGSSLPSHESPSHSEDSSWSRISTPPRRSTSPPVHNDIHSHVFPAYPGLPSTKVPRGRQRALTSQEKREALDVRKAKACWACHLSKIKCSPCSSGTPCQQCERLSGKRRFCWLPCFNDPLETLLPLLQPDYLFRDFTQTKVEMFVSQNATAWGNHEMTVRMNWGYIRPIEVRVVAITVHEDSQLSYVNQAVGYTMQPNEREIVVKKSPPIGLPLASMANMQDEYCTLIQEIVTNDPNEYVAIAYDDQESDLAERLLQAVSDFYSAGLAAGDECEPLRQVLEMHVTSTILDRSLILDDNSMYEVENYLQERYPRRSSPRCAQRQIKLAFVEVQKECIVRVLESWGNMMWTPNKNTPIEKKWARSFSVLIALTLVMDKILMDAYWTSESRIRSEGVEARKEKAEFQKLMRLMETGLFERCKEIFHSSFKTRKGGKEACNPIRDGIRAFRGKAVNEGISRFVWDLEAIIQEFGHEVRSHRSSGAEEVYDSPYTNLGRLSSIFLADFLD